MNRTLEETKAARILSICVAALAISAVACNNDSGRHDQAASNAETDDCSRPCRSDRGANPEGSKPGN
jgi:hypothetical protein